MKTLTTVFCTMLAFLCTTALAQVTTPAPSPFGEVDQKVGLTDVKIEYSRPSAKGRTIFGELVPYGKAWRAGANQATKVTFSTDVKFGDKELKAGSYALLITPNKDNWQLHFFNYNGGNWGSYVADGAPAAAAVVSAKPAALPMNVETWTIGIGDISNDAANLYFIWEKTYVDAKFTVATDAAVMASIEKTMAGPAAGDYSNAATYYLTQGKDLDQALTWINKGLELGGERFWLLRTKALIQAGLGDNASAIATAKRSTELAKEAGNDEYVRMNEKSIAEWME